MKSFFSRKSLQQRVSWVAASVLVAQPQMLLAADATPLPQAPVGPTAGVVEQIPHDVALAEGGVITGQVMDTAGKPLTNTAVSLHHTDREVARVQTDADGNFRVASLKGGVYHVTTTGHDGVYRFWAPRTAPPGSSTGLSLVSGEQVVRGQVGGGPFASMGQWIAEHPIITGAGIAAAIAIPLALQDDDDPPASP